MQQPFDAAALLQRVDRLTREARVAFLLSCAERLTPNYAAFTRHDGWGKPEVLQEALGLGWRFLSGNSVTRSEIEACLARCEAVTPDTETFQSQYVSAALDAAVCCAFVSELLLQDDPKKVVEGASLARDTVDMHIQDLENLNGQDPELEQKILRHPLMQRELKRQEEDLTMLETVDLSTSSTIEALARRWRSPAESNIGRSNR